jgi:hypothetical protein
MDTDTPIFVDESFAPGKRHCAETIQWLEDFWNWSGGKETTSELP